MKTLAIIDLTDTKSVQRYEDLLRKRLNGFGYCVTKRKTIQPGPHFIELKKTPKTKGFKITDVASGSTVAGENYDLSPEEVERFWSKEYEKWCVEQRERKRRKEQEKAAKKTRPKTICITGGWTVTNDERAIKTLKEHIAQYGDFDADGHGTEGDIASVMYKAYRPKCCPEFSHVWPVDGDWHNLTDTNLRSDADETTLPADLVPITAQRRIWHNERRIFLKLSMYDNLFFTTYSPEMFQLLCNKEELKSWYIQEQTRNTKTVHRLHCRVHGKITAFSELIALFDTGKVDMGNIAGSILEGKKWLRDNKLQTDHLRDNVGNNCPHSIAIMRDIKNGSKNDIVTRISAPYFFIVVRIGEDFRVWLGKCGTPDEYFRYIICKGAEQFRECLKAFYRIAKDSGEMLPKPEDHTKTACISQMLDDDGLEYHEGQYNPIEGLLRVEENTFTLWNGDLSLLKNQVSSANSRL